MERQTAAAVQATRVLARQVRDEDFDFEAAANLIALAFLSVAGACLAYGLWRLPPAYSLYGVASVAYPLFFPAKYVPLLSFPRFALAAFPIFVALALFTRDRPRAHRVIVVVMMLALAALTARFALFEWVA